MSRLTVGTTASLTRAFTPAEVREYEALTGDAADAPDAVPAGLLGGMVSELLGTRLPGRGTNWMKQRYVFERRARVGESLTTTVEISRVRPEKALINLVSTCTTRAGDVVFRGESLVLVRELE